MITIVFFGQLKERIETSQLNLDLNVSGETLDTVTKLRNYLISKGEAWKENLAYGKALVAVNHHMVTEDASIKDNDEIAFFPPVTGG